MFGATPVLVGDGPDWVSFGLQGAAAVGVQAGSTVTYAGALPGVSVVYDSFDGALKESLVLASPSAPSSFEFSVAVGAGDSRRRRAGGLAVSDAAGARVFDMEAPSMMDASGARSTAVPMTAAEVGGAWTVIVAADRGCTPTTTTATGLPPPPASPARTTRPTRQPTLTSDTGGGSTPFTYADSGQADRTAVGTTSLFASLTGPASATDGGGHTYC